VARSVLTLILAGGEGERLSILSQVRAKPGVPFGGKYRIIDFTLSNVVNSGLTDVGILTQYAPRSLIDHIGVERPWDLDRSRGGVTLLQPYLGRGRKRDWYRGTADAVLQNLDFIADRNPELVLVLAGDHVYKMDYRPFVALHRARDADLTVAVRTVPIEEANRLKTEFVSMVSHELRTPLTSIQGYAELLLEDERIAGEQRESLTLVKKNSGRLLGLINDLLDLSRMEAGRLDLHRTSLDLAHLIPEVAGTLRPLIEAKRQRLRLDLGDALPAVWADADRVTQILANLISNAHKYTLVEGSITVAARRDDGFVRVDVSDTGIGLSPEDQAQLFTKFFRAHDRSSQAGGGTGLGLVITRSLVELHGGRITVSSAAGRGSTFTFFLPVLEVSA